ncbi:MAG: RluA family pseudouridine synthase [Clostridia bacterium]|nr:RluA family pseudouridine synthase [Clostridia bacterium]
MIDVVYEDNHIIVVVKPPNVLTQGDATGDTSMLDMVKAYVKEKHNKPGNVYIGMVQRLDRPVGGLIVFARTSKAASRLSESIRENNIERIYTAVVHGETEKEEALKHYLLKDEKTNTVTAFDKPFENAKEAALEYKRIKMENGFSRLEIKLLTGRPHQIRVQLARCGHQIYGDMRYGKGEKGGIKLFCSKLGFEHPTKKEWLEFEKAPWF